jgi:DNA primase
MEVRDNHKRWLRRGGCLLLAGVAGWTVWHYWPDRHLARAAELRDQLTGEAGRDLSAEERRQLWDQFRQEARQLSPEKRRALFSEQQRKRMQEYFALSEKERAAFLDRLIDQMQQRRQQWQQNGNVRGPDGPAGGRQALTAEERDRRRKQRLDLSTPEERAERAQFFADLRRRREQRGLGNAGWGGRW